MDYIYINCAKCNTVRHPDATLIDFNYDDIKNIIDLNYITYLNYCSHKKKEIRKFLIKTYCTTFAISPNLYSCITRRPDLYSCVTNYNYVIDHNRFLVKEENNVLTFLLNNNNEMKKVSIEEFMNTIKKGTIINFNSCDVEPKLRIALFEHNPGFILKKINKISSDSSRCYFIYIIDTLNYTKPAFNLNYNLDKLPTFNHI